MGDRVERARAWRGVGFGLASALLALLATTALLFLIPTEGENPRAWGIIVCGVVTVMVCARFARRNWRLLRHYRAADLPPAHHLDPGAHRRSVHLVHRQPIHR
jgi:hypothetical protein